MATLDFDVGYACETTANGILIPIQIVHGGRTADLTARLDTGAADCLLDRFFAEVLGIDGENGVRQGFQTVTGSGLSRAYGHEVTLRTLGLEWSAMVYFYSAANPRHNFIGRRGWLDRVRMGLVHYEQLYLSSYNREQ